MVSVVDAILGGALNQGAKMETSSALKVRLRKYYSFCSMK